MLRSVRYCLRLQKCYYSVNPSNEEDLNSIICRQIRSAGPISVSEYMKLSLHHPIHGYYKTSSVIGPEGDFLLGIWIVSESMKYGKNTPFEIVEFGPGRGSLMTSVLTSLNKFPAANSLFRHLRFIERSDSLRKQQESAIFSVLKTCHSSLDVTWHSSLDEIPTGTTSFYLANEFLDALPIHRFQKVDGKWREVFVDAINPSNPIEPGDHLTFITSPSDTMASTTYLPFIDDLSEKTIVEVCPDGGALVQKMASRIAADGGSALIVDYGHVGERQDTLRAFKNHELHDPLKDPGQADITADVDFAFLRRSVEAANKPGMFKLDLTFCAPILNLFFNNFLLTLVVVHGPVSQAYFLIHMGILLRLKNLVARTKNEEEKQKLIASTEMLVGTNQMGKRFKFMAITAGRSEKEKQSIPAGFYPTWQTGEEEQSAS
ncbi:unnamed protein product [Rodentolepis nana]|uniref:Protein arginine methyltransferase NDUFAF7 n=1 Tax=Rodentolepis nana TaxID=102285 RepID=A0A0R3TSV7_RODNA|nr:unnamed protein product [Rodentolepis nana]